MAWLGLLHPAIDLAISYAEAYCPGATIPTSRAMHWLKLRATASLSAKAKRTYLLQLLPEVEGQILVRDHPYWKRMWTFQEFYIPKKNPVCRCGQLEFDYTTFDESFAPLVSSFWELQRH